MKFSKFSFSVWCVPILDKDLWNSCKCKVSAYYYDVPGCSFIISDARDSKSALRDLSEVVREHMPDMIASHVPSSIYDLTIVANGNRHHTPSLADHWVILSAVTSRFIVCTPLVYCKQTASELVIIYLVICCHCSR